MLKKEQECNTYKRDLRNFCERELEELVIKGSDWDNICDLDRNDSNYSRKNFLDTQNFHLDEMAPYRKVTKKEIQLVMKPWITKEILEKYNRRDSLLKSISVDNDKGKLTILHNNYKKLRNKITKDKRDSKKVYFTAYFEMNKNKSATICGRV